METVLLALAVLALVLVAGAALSRFVQVVTVRDYERGVRFSRGRLTGLVTSGSHTIVRPFTEIEVLDGRPTSLVLSGQEVATADGVQVKVTLAARYVVADPVAATTGDADYRSAIYLMLQLAIRDAIARRTLEETLAARRELGPIVHQACGSDLATLGIELLSVAVRDLMVPAELKRAYAAVIAARREGEAALERARTETAALRSLANAGRMVEDNPGLLQLRLLQQVGGSTGNTVMLSVPDGQSRPTVLPSAPAVRQAARRPARTASSPDAD